MKNAVVALILLFAIAHGFGSRVAAKENADLRIIVDQLVVPVMKISVGPIQRVYPELRGFKRLVYEPWSKFSYRISSTFILEGDEASELEQFLEQQIANKSPTGLVGHEANLMVTVMSGDSVEYQVSLSKGSRSSVYLEEGRPRIGHFRPTKRISQLLKLESIQEQKIDVEQGAAPQIRPRWWVGGLTGGGSVVEVVKAR